MKFEAEGIILSRGARFLLFGFIVAVLSMLLIVNSSRLTNANASASAPPVGISNNMQRIVYPMLITATAYGVTGSGSQHAITIRLEAGNNLAIEPNYANATVVLKSLDLALRCSSPSSNLAPTTVNLETVPNVAVSTNHNVTFSVSSDGLQIPSESTLTCTVSGTFTYQLTAIVVSADGTTNRTINGKGVITQYSSQVLVAQ